MNQTRRGRGWSRAGLAGLLAVSLAAGCAKQAGTVVVPDDSAVRVERARQHAVLGERALDAGRTDEAVVHFQRSLQESTNLYSVWNSLGLIAMEREEYQDAAQMFLAAANLAPTNPTPYYNVGLVYDRAGHSQRALEFYQRALEVDPRHVNSLRGALRSARLLQLADERSLRNVRTALMLERDAEWRAFFEREQLRIEGQLAEQRSMLDGVRPGAFRSRSGSGQSVPPPSPMGGEP